MILQKWTKNIGGYDNTAGRGGVAQKMRRRRSEDDGMEREREGDSDGSVGYRPANNIDATLYDRVSQSTVYDLEND